MVRYLYWLLFCIIVSNCKQNISPQKSLRTINVDSCINAFSKDTSIDNRLIALYKLRDNYVLDTFQKATILYAVFKNSSAITNDAISCLDSILNFEKTLNVIQDGRKLLSDTYYELLINKFTATNDFIKIAEACEKYLKYASDTAKHQSLVLNILADNYLRLGDITKCKFTLENALRISTRNKETDQKANILVSLSNYYAIVNNNIQAAAMISDALEIKNLSTANKNIILLQQANTESDNKKKITLTNNLLSVTNSNYIKFTGKLIIAKAYQEQFEFNKAIATLLEAIKIPEQEPRMIAKQYVELSDIYANLNKIDSAKYCLDMGLKMLTPLRNVNGFTMPILDKLIPENTIMDLCNSKAMLYMNDTTNLDNFKIASNYLLSAKKVAELIRTELLFDESKYFMGIDLKKISESLIQCYYTIYQKTKDINYARKAFEIVEENKSVALQDKLEQEILQGISRDSNYEHFINLRMSLNDIEIAMDKTKDAAAKDSLYSISLSLASRLSKFQQLKNTATFASINVSTFDEMQTFLKSKNFNVLSYFIGDEKVFMFYLNASTKQLQFAQCDTSIKSTIQNICDMQRQENILNTQQKIFTKLSNELYKKLVGIFLNIETANTTLILPDGVLNNIAFDALLTDGNKINSYLIKQHKLCTAYSISSLMSQQQRPFISTNSILTLAPFISNDIRNLPQLAGSALESSSIAKLFTANIYNNNAATFQNFKSNISNNKYVHIASHASAGEAPKLEFYDSSVYVNSLYQIPMHQSVAYLNTCQSGSGVNYYSEGNLSLGRAFYSNGVHNVLLSLWNMNDVASEKLSTSFYKSLKATNNSIDALHESKLAYLQSQPLDMQAPYYWANLQHIGDGNLGDDGSYKMLLVIISSFIIFVGLYFYKKRKKTI
jgi:CHAT domain-containing protein